MAKAGLPMGVKMRHDSHYVDQIASHSRSVGRTIPIESIYPNPKQPRTEFGDLEELTASIKEKGVLEPLLVKPDAEGRYMIIAGERRYRSSQIAGLVELPCIEMDIDENDIAEIALIENLQRKDLNIWEEADGLAALASRFSYTQDDIAKKISKSRSTVSELMTIAGLPEDVRVRCRSANIASKSTLLEIARQFDDDAMHRFLDGITTGEILPRTKQKKDVQPEAKHSAARPPKPDNSHTFTYVGTKPKFTLELRFEDSAKRTRAEILRALKAAFDSVKSESD